MPDVPNGTFADFTLLVEQLSGKKLADLIRNPMVDAAQCSSLCDCHGRYCGCYGSVSAMERRGQEVVLPADYAKIRDMKIAELREQLSHYEK